MSKWVSLDEASARATQAVGRDVSINDILEMATAGHIRIAARIPEWERPGVGELPWIYPDGTRARAVATKDGVALGIDPTRIDLLAMHGRVSLAGIRWQADDVQSDAGAISLIAGPGSPFIVADDLRILDTELRRVVAILNDEPCPPREQPAPACADRQKLRVSADERARAEIYNRWQELAGQICELRDSERDAGLAPTEREAAVRLRTRADEALRELEGDPAFIVAMDAMIVRLEADRDLIFKGGENDHRAQALMKLDAQIESWQAHVARIKGEASCELQQVDVAAAGAPQSRQRHHEQEILRTLQALGHDPLLLPRKPAGTPGPKAEARAALPKMTPKQFDKAWDRLRGFKDIQDAD